MVNVVARWCTVSGRRATRGVLLSCLVTLLLMAPALSRGFAQDAVEPGGDAGPTAAPLNTGPSPDAATTPPAAKPGGHEIDFFSLLVQGGVFMIPILGMSILAVTMAVERAINLRRGRIMPPQLIAALGQLGTSSGGFDPRKAYRICQQYPSVAATVIRSMLLKIGRPHSEVEHAVSETCQREAERLYANVRWLNLAVAVTPLIGLLGTVWGMIICFHDTTYIDNSTNRSEALAEGIYIALVTTLGGLMVAIPAAVASHFFEGRIQSLMFQVEEMVFNLLPQIERFEGRVRFTRHHAEGTEPRNGDAVEADDVRTAGAK
jgi:biopolymer transport protein ExbB